MLERRLIAVEGVVQGVGFRPYVHRLAAANVLRGSVCNSAAGVLIDVQGEATRVDEFCRQLTISPPALASIASVRFEHGVPQDYDAFRIAPSCVASTSGVPAGQIPADAATCDACLAELVDPTNRRFGHPFITCTDCGPRFTIVHDTPYDRERTSMTDFPMCAECQREYGDPEDRRYHAESIACWQCGPRLLATKAGGDGPREVGSYAIAAAVASLHAGDIVAIKSLGGFHLVCDATDPVAVQRLRARKHRPAKPFALMVADVAAADAICELSPVERDALASRTRPIVLVSRRAHAAIATAVAPSSAMVGLMLPSTPLQHLLLRAAGGPLIMTSGNRSGDPVVTDDAGARAALGDIADLFLTHDRDIVARCDDSVTRVVAGETRLVRRARGHVPGSVGLPFVVEAPVLATGGHLKNTVCVAHGRSAQLSAHVGDLDTASSREALRSAIDRTLRQAGTHAAVIAHDLHPDYASTAVALAFGAEQGISRRVAVQHHHAHVAACVAEYGVTTPVIGVVFDGAGLGSDGAIWGGEFLVVDGARFTRCGHLGYVPLPGGDAAARKPWRSAAAHLAHLGPPAGVLATARPSGIGEQEWRLVQQIITRGVRAPQTSSIGRLFDAVASLIGLCHESSFEGEAALQLEAAAHGTVSNRYSVTLSGGECWTSDPANIIEGIVTDHARGRTSADIASAFHGALRTLIVLGCERIRENLGRETVVLSGGVFCNALLAESASAALVARGFRVLLPRLVPCNDGGLSLGQAYVAACAHQEDPCV